MKKGLIVIVVVVALAGLAVLATHDSSPKKSETTNSNNQTNQTSTDNTPATKHTATNANATATITYSDDGFSPANLTVKAGTTITLKNTSSTNSVQFSSDPHPTHTDDPELNQDLLGPGQSMTFVVHTTGSFGYHNHLDQSQRGRITIN